VNNNQLLQNTQHYVTNLRHPDVHDEIDVAAVGRENLAPWGKRPSSNVKLL